LVNSAALQIEGGEVELEESAAGMVRGETIQLSESSTGFVAGQEVTLQEAKSWAVVGGVVRVEGGQNLVVIGQHVDGQVQPLLNLQGAALFGILAGLAGTLLLILRNWLKRQQA
jgi:hypothetical protein